MFSLYIFFASVTLIRRIQLNFAFGFFFLGGGGLADQINILWWGQSMSDICYLFSSEPSDREYYIYIRLTENHTVIKSTCVWSNTLQRCYEERCIFSCSSLSVNIKHKKMLFRWFSINLKIDLKHFTNRKNQDQTEH